MGYNNEDVCAPEDTEVRVGRLEDTVHDTPVDVSRDTLELDTELLANSGRGTIRTDQVLAPDVLGLTGDLVDKRRGDGVLLVLVLRDRELLDGRKSLNNLAVAKKVAQVDLLDAVLGRDVETAVARVAHVRVAEHELATILPDRSTLNDDTTNGDVGCETPVLESLEVTRLDTVGTAGDKGAFGFV